MSSEHSPRPRPLPRWAPRPGQATRLRAWECQLGLHMHSGGPQGGASGAKNTEMETASPAPEELTVQKETRTQA